MLSYIRDRNALPFEATRAPPPLQLMWWYLALCAFRYSGYLEVQSHCTLARSRPNMLNFTETAYTHWVHGNMSNFDMQCTCPRFGFELLICCSVRIAPSSHFDCWSFVPALILTCPSFAMCECLAAFIVNCWSFAMCKCPQPSFWVVHRLQCTHALSFYFSCNVHRWGRYFGSCDILNNLDVVYSSPNSSTILKLWLGPTCSTVFHTECTYLLHVIHPALDWLCIGLLYTYRLWPKVSWL